MRKFARQLDDWLKTALDDVPLPLQQTKIDRESTPPSVCVPTPWPTKQTEPLAILSQIQSINQ